jgi:hypothetical protein
MGVVRLQNGAAQRRPVKMLQRQLDEIHADVQWYLARGQVRQALQLSRKWLRLQRAGGR